MRRLVTSAGAKAACAIRRRAEFLAALVRLCQHGRGAVRFRACTDARPAIGRRIGDEVCDRTAPQSFARSLASCRVNTSSCIPRAQRDATRGAHAPSARLLRAARAKHVHRLANIGDPARHDVSALVHHAGHSADFRRRQTCPPPASRPLRSSAALRKRQFPSTVGDAAWRLGHGARRCLAIPDS